jgi:hypothetical protein
VSAQLIVVHSRAASLSACRATCCIAWTITPRKRRCALDADAISWAASHLARADILPLVAWGERFDLERV